MLALGEVIIAQPAHHTAEVVGDEEGLALVEAEAGHLRVVGGGCHHADDGEGQERQHCEDERQGEAPRPAARGGDTPAGQEGAHWNSGWLRRPMTPTRGLR